jgi:hypothetical protein
VHPRLTLLLLSMLTLGCGDATKPPEDDPGDGISRDPGVGTDWGDPEVASEWVTGAAAQALDATRHFTFAPLPETAGEMSRAAAVRVATAYFTTLLTSIGNTSEALEEQHGGAIDFAALTMCGRVIPISAPFLPSTVRPEAEWARNLMAGRYAFEFCEGTGPRAVGLEMAATADVTIADDGTLRYPGVPIIYGNEFLSFGIPPRLRFTPDIFVYGLWALSPEGAVKALYSRVHAPVQSVPRATGCLWWVDPCVGNLARHWRLELAEPVPIRRQGATEDELAQVFYVQVGFGARGPGGVYVPAREQPPPAYEVADFMNQHTVIDSILLTLAEPLAMDSFTVAGE